LAPNRISHQKPDNKWHHGLNSQQSYKKFTYNSIARNDQGNAPFAQKADLVVNSHAGAWASKAHDEDGDKSGLTEIQGSTATMPPGRRQRIVSAKITEHKGG
jgi:hypothetical protein